MAEEAHAFLALMMLSCDPCSILLRVLSSAEGDLILLFTGTTLVISTFCAHCNLFARLHLPLGTVTA